MVIYCTNPTCRALATQPVGRCQTCQTPLPYRFLLAISDASLSLSPQALVAERYRVWQHPIWLDTKPEHPIAALDQIPPRVLPYLRLSDQVQHMPRPYTYLDPAETGLAAAVLLLEAAPLAVTVDWGDRIQVALLPTLKAAWPQGTALQQLDWLRQMAHLWSALDQENVSATLLAPNSLRVDGALVRLAALVSNQARPQPVSLATLGQYWKTWVAGAQPQVREYLAGLVQALISGEIDQGPSLALELETAVQTLAQGLTVTVDWSANTDQGPSRDRNEDACYPQGSTQQQRLSGDVATGAGHSGQALPLLVVCDGIGGHEQGNVASQTAIKTMVDELQSLAQEPDLSPRAVAQRLKQAVIAANNAISTRNNDEHRSARARMGTTVVAALVHFPYVSIAHIGDSRAYRISQQTCYQITLDDDVASREAHLGYALYPEATQMPGGGALVQALGINDSGYLYPTVKHFLLDDPVVLLLCSDGLSDYDRVDILWPYTVRSLVGNADPLTPVIQGLIQQANRLNGHDNVTVGLMRFLPQLDSRVTLPAQRLGREKPPEANPIDSVAAAPSPTLNPTTQVAPAPAPKQRPWLALAGGAVIGLALLAVAAWAYTRWQPRTVLWLPLGDRWPDSLSGDPLWPLAQTLTTDIESGSFWQTQVSNRPALWPDTLSLASTPSLEAGAAAPVIPTGSILRVVSRQTLADQTQWVRLQVCSIPAGESLASGPAESDQPPADTAADIILGQQLAQPGAEGWVLSHYLVGTATFLNAVAPNQIGGCLSTP